MKVLVTGGTGVIGAGVVASLLKRKFKVRLLSRAADEASQEWNHAVEPFSADVTDPGSLRGCAAGCDVVLHITGIVTANPPDQTFEKVNVTGTQNVLNEALDAGVTRFVYMSSLGVDRGSSAYHKSKQEAEARVRHFRGEWVILRPGSVFGPGDEVISLLLKMVRTLPAVPLIGWGDQQFQPIWYKDLGEASALSVASADLESRILELAGLELTSMNDILDRFELITNRKPIRLPIPKIFARIGVQFTEGTAFPFPLDEARLKMLLEGNVIQKDSENALVTVFKLKPTPLQQAMQELADSLPEQLPDRGIGTMERKIYLAKIQHSPLSPSQLMTKIRQRWTELMPLDFASENIRNSEIEKGSTITGRIPFRGNIQIRAEQVTPTRLTFVTLEGHPLSGVLDFMAEMNDGLLHFRIETNTRASNLLDLVAMKSIGDLMQSWNWQQVVENVVRLSGGQAPEGVQVITRSLDAETAKDTEAFAKKLVKKRKQAQSKKKVNK